MKVPSSLSLQNLKQFLNRFLSKVAILGAFSEFVFFCRISLTAVPKAILYPAVGILAQLVVLVVVIYYCEVRRQKDIFLHRGTIAHMFQQIQELSTDLLEISQYP